MMRREVRARSFPRASSWGALVFALGGCGLFLAEPNEPLCGFAGDTTACGACLKEQCLDAVGACCGAASCRPALSAVASCAADGSCSSSLAGAGAVNVSTCLERACRTACGTAGEEGGPGGEGDGYEPGVGDGAPNDSPHDSGSLADVDATSSSADATTAKNKTHCAKLGTSDAACDCKVPLPSDSKVPNDVTCNEAVAFHAVCCAGTGWPNQGSTCSCLSADCDSPGGGGCSCSLGVAGETCTDGTVCCVSPAGACFCTYQGTDCAMGYKEVEQCDGLAIGCRPGTNRVTSCSLAK